jgi:hypothetical protein
MTSKPISRVEDQSRRHEATHTQEMLAGVLFLILVPIIAHLLFSWMGMNPTDDGFFLGMSRRILDGEIPHRDFISVRPVGTGILWSPVVFLGGDYTIWISRFFVWFQFACIAWIWTVLIYRMLKQVVNLTEQIIMALVAFVGTATTFILIPWPTIDGLWFVSIGFLLCMSGRSFNRLPGYAMIGAACLFKQNFLVLGPVFLVVLGDWCRFRYWLAVALPGFAYLVFIWITGALADFTLQMTSHAELIQTGFYRYLQSTGVQGGIIIGFFGLLVVFRGLKTPQFNLPRNVWLGLLSVGPAVIILPLAPGMFWISGPLKYSFALFGMIVGTTVYFLCYRKVPFEMIKAAILVLAVMWTVSISLGCNFPVLGAGIAMVLLTGCLRNILASEAAEGRFQILWRSCLLVCTAILLVCFVIGRSWRIYVEQPAWKLTCSLDGVLPGGRMIRTNPVTYEYLKELHDTIEQLQGREFAIIPDDSIYWVKASQKNRLPTDWPHDIELSTPALFNRVTQSLESQRGRLVFLVAKVTGFSLGDKPVPFGKDGIYKIVPYVQSHFHKVGETQYWTVYE